MSEEQQRMAEACPSHKGEFEVRLHILYYEHMWVHMWVLSNNQSVLLVM